MVKHDRTFFTSNQLHILAMLFMLLDHMWATVISGNMWMTYVGRLAFPIFAFMLVQGYLHTHDLKKYKQRMLIVAIVSEIPFNLVAGGSFFYPFHQNVCWTLLLGLYALEILDDIHASDILIVRLKKAFKLMGILFIASLSMCDYGLLGIAMVFLFYITRNNQNADKLFQLVGMIFLNTAMIGGMMIPIHFLIINIELPVQSFAVFSLLFIWLYNGNKGIKNKGLQLGFYAFYPLHLLILGLIYILG